MDSELESFKSNIDLRCYAREHGYRLDRKESWRGSAVMRHANGDKIMIKRDADGHYVYFSVRDDRDNGTIIDFVRNRQGLSLGAVRKELRQWLGRPVAPPSYPALTTTGKDRLRIERTYARTREALRHLYLENERGLSAELLACERFAGRIRIDARGNAVFPHFDAVGLCGYEMKNHGFTGFATGGTKGLWTSHEHDRDDRLVFCESAIDALSHATLFANDRARYASIGGQVNPSQPELIQAAVARMRAGSEIVAAMDADAAGRKLSEVVRRAVELSGRDDLDFYDHEPSGFKDWNDQIRGRPKLSRRPRREEPSVA
jgi:Protein of unknown function (DUF3991)/Toprim-like